IPAYNAERVLDGCLKSIRDSVGVESYELLVVDDGSTDRTHDIASKYADRVLKHQNNKGLRAGRETLRTSAEGEIIVFMDADVEIPNGFLKCVGDYFKENPTVDVMAAIVSLETPATNFLSRYKNAYVHYVYQVSPEDSSAIWGGCFAIRREKALPFDEYRGYWAEDTAYAHYLKSNGRKIHLAKEAQVIHYHKYDMRDLLMHDFKLSFAWTEIFIQYSGFNQMSANLGSFSNAPRRLILAVLLAPLTVLTLFISTWLAVAILLIWFWLNFPFFYFLLNKFSWIFTIKSFFVTWVDHIIRGLGIASGLTLHIFIRKNFRNEA
ncbi:MAG: glycosyltransferase family 2 protein, partial [Candidatus Omnitrophica bacterium]|nr:glycosyltransferase family 2 protein [Candidatus Omnitrophota bacterium]